MSKWILRRDPSAGLLFLALLFALSWSTPAHAQAHDRRPLQSVIDSALDDDAAHPAAYFTQAAEAEPPGASPTYTVSTPPRVVMGPLDVMFESIFGPASKEDWKPLELMSFFSQGWDQPFVNAPEGTNGAPKQNWIGAPNGVFGRFATLDFFYTNHINDVPGVFLTPNAPFMPVHTFTTGNQYAAYSTILLPLNSRMELLLGTVFITSNKSSPAGHYTGNWGDTGIQARFHMIEQRNFSVVSTIGERIPTGKSVNGSDINYITPGLEFWWNFAPAVGTAWRKLDQHLDGPQVGDERLRQPAFDGPLPDDQGSRMLQGAGRSLDGDRLVGHRRRRRARQRHLPLSRPPVRTGQAGYVVRALRSAGPGQWSPALCLAASVLPHQELLISASYLPSREEFLMRKRAFKPDALSSLEDRVVLSAVTHFTHGSVVLSGLKYNMAVDLVRRDFELYVTSGNFERLRAMLAQDTARLPFHRADSLGQTVNDILTKMQSDISSGTPRAVAIALHRVMGTIHENTQAKIDDGTLVVGP